MAVQAAGPNPVRSIAALSQEEIDRYNAVWSRMEGTINADQQIPNASRQAVLDAAVRSVNNFALNRGFYSSEIAREIEIDVQIAPKIITQQPESIGATIRKIFVQAIFGTLGWAIAAEIHPVAGIAIGVTGLVANSGCCQREIDAFYR